MKWLPSIEVHGHRYFLPRSRALESALARTLILQSIGNDVAAVGLLSLAIASDPPLAIFAADRFMRSQDQSLRCNDESGSIGADSPNKIAIDALADCLLRQLPDLLADDAALGKPADAPELAAAVLSLRQRFAAMDRRRWLAESHRWLELTGRRCHWDGSRWELTGSPAAESTSEAGVDPLGQLAGELRDLSGLRHRFAEVLDDAKTRSLGELAYGLSHEINNPLTNIATRAEALIDRPADPAARNDSLRKIVDQSYRAFGMIADLMFYARPHRPEKTTFDLSGLLCGLADEFGDRPGMTLRAEVPASMAICGDRTMIGEAIRQVLRNAADAVAPSGTIVMTAAVVQDRARILIADSGPGLSPTDRVHATDPYYSGREAGRGLGMGLCKARKILAMHGGGLQLRGEVVGCVAEVWVALG